MLRPTSQTKNSHVTQLSKPGLITPCIIIRVFPLFSLMFHRNCQHFCSAVIVTDRSMSAFKQNTFLSQVLGWNRSEFEISVTIFSPNDCSFFRSLPRLFVFYVNDHKKNIAPGRWLKGRQVTGRTLVKQLKEVAVGQISIRA